MKKILLILTLIYIPFTNCQSKEDVRVFMKYQYSNDWISLLNEKDEFMKSFYRGKITAYREMINFINQADIPDYLNEMED